MGQCKELHDKGKMDFAWDLSTMRLMEEKPWLRVGHFGSPSHISLGFLAIDFINHSNTCYFKEEPLCSPGRVPTDTENISPWEVETGGTGSQPAFADTS